MKGYCPTCAKKKAKKSKPKAKKPKVSHQRNVGKLEKGRIVAQF